ncbi:MULTISPECIES: acyl carrier protein [Isoptericola]|uniref:acyl carrier protein n=1 Tax=Isoptericola TaxID=254250 RepID=UPI00383AF041
MTVTIDEIQDEIKNIVCDILEVEPDEVTRTSMFKEDHDADSLRAIEIVSSLERGFGIDIAQADMARMVNMDGVLSVVDEALARK